MNYINTLQRNTFYFGLRGSDDEDDEDHQVVCKNCEDKYELGAKDGLCLCEKCFSRFNVQLMIGRMHCIEHSTMGRDYFESSDDWVAAQKGGTA